MLRRFGPFLKPDVWSFLTLLKKGPLATLGSTGKSKKPKDEPAKVVSLGLKWMFIREPCMSTEALKRLCCSPRNPRKQVNTQKANDLKNKSLQVAAFALEVPFGDDLEGRTPVLVIIRLGLVKGPGKRALCN